MKRSVLVLLGLVAALPAIAAPGAGVGASSELTADDGERHPADLAFDGLLKTAWCEGETGVGEGAWLELRFAAPTEVTSLSIWPGDLSNGRRSLREKGRPGVIALRFDDDPETREVPLRDGAEAGPVRVDVDLEEPRTVRRIRLTIAEARAGYIHNDTCIAEVAVNHVRGDRAPVAKLRAWAESAAGAKLADAHRNEAIALFDRIAGAEFGDTEAMRALMDWAADGAPYLRERARKEVPPGFRLQAIPPDETALQALLKLKDANAVPALQLAALRSEGDAQRKLEATTGLFEAHTELANGGRRTLPTWGTEGWEKGALRTFGEPAGVALGPEQRLYVADVGNHRVQVFDAEGRTVGEWGGGEPTVTDRWFDGRRKHYVAGRTPGNTPRAFTNPYAVALLQGRDGLRVLVLDATNRLQVLDERGKHVATWDIPARRPSGGTGGAGQILPTKRGVVVLVGDEGFVLDPKTGAVTNRWTIEEGDPITAAALPNGRLLLGFPRRIAEYDVTGFRHRTVMDRDAMPSGMEAWAMAVDDRGKLWMITDNGWAIKFKKPGVEDWRIRWSEVGGTAPSFAVEDDILWVVADGKIRRIDALEVKAEAEGR